MVGEKDKGEGGEKVGKGGRGWKREEWVEEERCKKGGKERREEFLSAHF